MTGGSAAPAPQAGNPVTSIVDTVCVLYFAASGQIDLFVKTMEKVDYLIFLPEEVLDEARTRAAQKGWNIRGLDRHLQIGPPAAGAAPRPIQVVPRIDGSNPAAATLLAQVRGRHPKATAAQQAAARQRAEVLREQQQHRPVSRLPVDEHLGECVVVTHGVLATRRQMDVYVGVDDLDGQTLATRHRLRYFTVEDALSLAVEHEVLDMNGARKSYEKMRDYGYSLPSWKAGLRDRLRREARARRKKAQPGE